MCISVNNEQIQCMYVCSCIQLKECNDRLTKIQVPHDFSRAVKGLDQIKLWKGVYT